MEKRVAERTLLCGTPSSWYCKFEKLDTTRTLNVLSKRKFFMNIGSLPLKPRSYRYRIIPYFHAVSYAFSKSKNTAVKFFFYMKVSLMKVSSRIKWSMVPLLFQNPVCIFVMWPFVSRYHVSLLFITRSIVLQRQLVNGFDVSLPDFGINYWLFPCFW